MNTDHSTDIASLEETLFKLVVIESARITNTSISTELVERFNVHFKASISELRARELEKEADL